MLPAWLTTMMAGGSSEYPSWRPDGLFSVLCEPGAGRADTVVDDRETVRAAPPACVMAPRTQADRFRRQQSGGCTGSGLAPLLLNGNATAVPGTAPRCSRCSDGTVDSRGRKSGMRCTRPMMGRFSEILHSPSFQH